LKLGGGALRPRPRLATLGRPSDDNLFLTRNFTGQLLQHATRIDLKHASRSSLYVPNPLVPLHPFPLHRQARKKNRLYTNPILIVVIILHFTVLVSISAHFCLSVAHQSALHLSMPSCTHTTKHAVLSLHLLYYLVSPPCRGVLAAFRIPFRVVCCFLSVSVP